MYLLSKEHHLKNHQTTHNTNEQHQTITKLLLLFPALHSGPKPDGGARTTQAGWCGHGKVHSLMDTELKGSRLERLDNKDFGSVFPVSV